MATGRHFSSGNDAPMQTSPMNGAAGVRPVRTAAVKNTYCATGGKRKSAGVNGPRRPRWNKPVKPAIVVALVAALALVGVGGVLAWLVSTDSLTNTFDIGQVDVDINENGPDGDEFDQNVDTVKKNVVAVNEGNVPVWVRAQVNIYWVDGKGNQLWDQPEAGTDYEFTASSGGASGLPANVAWAEGGDGYYYLLKPLEPKDGEGNGGISEQLIETLTALNSKEGRHLVCDITMQTIQAEPHDAVEEAWGVTVTGEGDSSQIQATKGIVNVTSSTTSTESEVA
ncbi:hypothetical protein QUW40_06145 [Collinsella tanakaei]|uniref:hypothetical protein n=1 Tax=Collinsella tanakaei TaxID=626935 RepID=UPI0025A32ED2|nr:hypothetical protein [Collinsella tanakaei]MDM8246179.1 hypothetical protein [Collinsella tanakaei]